MVALWDVLFRAHDSNDKVDDSDSEQSFADLQWLSSLYYVRITFDYRQTSVSSRRIPWPSPFHSKGPKQPMTSLTRTL